MNDDNLSGKNSLGEAANRYVTFQIVSSIIAGIIFLVFLFAFIIPAFNHSNSSSGFSQSGPSSVIGPAGQQLTIDNRPATPEEKDAFNRQIKDLPPQPAAQGVTAPPTR